MTMFLAPYTAIADIDGSPLDAGFLFFGEYGKDPELFPVEVFWDADFTMPAAQPIRTRNGYPVRNGSPTKVYLKTAQHSIVIKNRNSAFILVDFNNKGWSASFVVDASGRTQQQVNDLGIPYWREKVGGYEVNSRVMLTDGSIVKSMVGGNITNPNLDMAGWEVDVLGTIPQYQYTQMGKAFSSTDGANDNAAMWPHANIKYDETNDNFIILYNTNSGHDIVKNSVLFRTKPANADAFSNPIIVASDKNNYSYKCQGSGIAANGDYVAIIAQFNWGGSYIPVAIWVYRSLNKGATWSRTQMLDASNDDEAILAYNGDASGFLRTQSGRILTFANHPTTVEARIYYSDDNGTTWRKSTLAGNPTDVTEPAWCDLGGGKLVCYARAAVRYGGTSQIIPAKVMKSTDNGLSWSAPVNSSSIPNMTLGNGELLPDFENRTVEFVFHSRYTDGDNYCSLYRSCGTFDDAFNDRMQKPERIGKMVAYTSYLTSTGDSGYVGAAKDKNGNIFGMFYTGQRTGTTGLSQLSYFVAGRSKKQDADFILDFRSGEKISYNDILPAVNSTAPKAIDLYLSGKTKVTNLAAGFVQSTGGSGSWTQGATSLDVSVSALSRTAYRTSLQTVDAIDLTHIKTISVKVDSYLSNGSLNDIAISIYSSKTVNPSLPLTNRLLISATKKAGVLDVDVSALTGACYIHLVASTSNLNPTDTTLSASVSEIKLIGYDSEVFDLSSKLLPTKSTVFNKSFDFAGVDGVGSPITRNTGTQVVTTANGFIHLQTTSASSATTYSAAVVIQKPIPRKATFVSCDFECDTALISGTEGDYGLAVFSKSNPVSTIDERIEFLYRDVNGKHVLKLPDAVETVDHYVAVVLNHNKTTEVNLRANNLKYHFS